jgi:hypothetical protein
MGGVLEWRSERPSPKNLQLHKTPPIHSHRNLDRSMLSGQGEVGAR